MCPDGAYPLDLKVLFDYAVNEQTLEHWTTLTPYFKLNFLGSKIKVYRNTPAGTYRVYFYQGIVGETYAELRERTTSLS